MNSPSVATTSSVNVVDLVQVGSWIAGEEVNPKLDVAPPDGRGETLQKYQHQRQSQSQQSAGVAVTPAFLNENINSLQEWAAASCVTILAAFVIVTTLIVANILNIVIITVGAIYSDDCPAKPNLTAVLIVFGSLSIVFSTVAVLSTCAFTTDTFNSANTDTFNSGNNKATGIFCFVCIPLNAVIGFAVFGLFIALCVIVYGLHPIVTYTEPMNPTTYCHPSLFLFSFWFLNVCFIILGCAIIPCCCCGCFALFAFGVAADELADGRNAQGTNSGA